MIKDYDHAFGPEGTFAWPATLEIAESLLEEASYAKTTDQCLDDGFFYQSLNYLDGSLEYEYSEEEALEVAELAAKGRKELFKEAKNWPLPYLVASATYKILSAKDEGVYMISRLGDCFFWPFLSFDEPLFDMLRTKGWDKLYKNKIRKGFHYRLRFEIRGFTLNKLIWGSDKDQVEDQSKDPLKDQPKDKVKDKPWFTCECFARRIYPEDVIRCLDLVGIDPGLAHSAVDQVFKLQSLTPLYYVLSDDPSLTIASNVTMPGTVVKGRHKSEKEEAESPKNPSAGLPIHYLKFICGAFLLAGAAILSTRLRSPRSNWNSTQPVLTFVQPGPCFAATGRQRWNPPPLATANQAPPEQPGFETGATTSASKMPRSQRLSAAFKNVTLKLSRTKSPDLLSRQNTRRMWRITNASQSGVSTQPLAREKSAVASLRQTFSDVKTEIQKAAFKLYEIVIKRADGIWVDDGRIFTEGSTQVKDLRSKLQERNILLPPGTSLCIHVRRTPDDLKFTVQGTRTEFNKQGFVMKCIQEDFLVDGTSVKPVKEVGLVEIDHIWSTKVTSLANLRSSIGTHDGSFTVRLTPALHKLRTSYFRAVKPKYDLGNLTQPLSEVVKSVAEADKKLWSNKKHRAAVFGAGLTQTFLLQQYAGGHRFQVSRMAGAIDDSGLSSRQATAYVADEVTREGSVDNFVDCLVQIPEWKDDLLPEWKGDLQYVKQRAERCYREKVRLANVKGLGNYFSQCIEFADDFESYSRSPEGVRDGCTASQTARHRKTKMKATDGFLQALEEGFETGLANGSISQTFVDDEVDQMLANANVDRDGNSTAIPLATEALKARIKTRGEALHVDSLYLRDNVFKIKAPNKEKAIIMYEECVKSAATKLKKVSPSSQQEASTSYQQEASTSYQQKASDGSSPFLP